MSKDLASHPGLQKPDPDAATVRVVRGLLDERPPTEVSPAECGRFGEHVQALYDAHREGGTERVRKAFGVLAEHDDDFAELVASYVEGESQRFDVGSFAAALETRTPLTWRVEGLITDGSVNVFFGDGGTKKTWVLLDLLLAVALGGRWLGRETVQGVALVIDEESGTRRLLDRLQALGAARHAGPGTPLHWTSLDGLNLYEDDADAGELANLIEQLGVSIVLIDSLSMVSSGADENGTEDMAPVFGRLRRVAEATDAVIIIIHHSNRGGTYRGSTAIKQSCDLMIKVESREGSPNIDFSAEKARDIETFEMAAHIRFESGDDGRVEAVYVSPADPVEVPESWSPGEQHVLGYLAEHGPSAVAEITARPEITTESSARNGVYSLAKKGKVKRVNGGASGKKAIYDLTEIVMRQQSEPVNGGSDAPF